MIYLFFIIVLVHPKGTLVGLLLPTTAAVAALDMLLEFLSRATFQVSGGLVQDDVSRILK